MPERPAANTNNEKRLCLIADVLNTKTLPRIAVEIVPVLNGTSYLIHGAGGGKKSSNANGYAMFTPDPPPSGVVQNVTAFRRGLVEASVAKAWPNGSNWEGLAK
jgi:hypothetical protein